MDEVCPIYHLAKPHLTLVHWGPSLVHTSFWGLSILNLAKPVHSFLYRSVSQNSVYTRGPVLLRHSSHCLGP